MTSSTKYRSIISPGIPLFVIAIVFLSAGFFLNQVQAQETDTAPAASELSADEIEILMMKAKSSNPNTRLHLRADREVRHEMVKKVIDASSRGGVNQVIFSTYTTDK